MQEQSDIEIINNFMDNAEVVISSLPPAQVAYQHIFVPGLYIRKMYLPANSILTSKVHKKEHAFIVNKGRILVYDGIHEAVILKAPYDGITMPGTRRMGYAIEDTIWMNLHPTKIKPVDDSEEALQDALVKIERSVIEPYKNLQLT